MYLLGNLQVPPPERPEQLLIAINKEGEARAVTSGIGLSKTVSCPPSSVQAALKGLLEGLYYARTGASTAHDRFLWNLARGELLTGSPDNRKGAQQQGRTRRPHRNNKRIPLHMPSLT